ncbi:MAG: electron transport complex subunit RsxG [Gallionella sp.]|nr:electron transport complex subunit RsxG [Gallionella sp.]
MRRTMAKASFLTAMNLLFFTVIGTAILAITYNQTHERIAQSELAEKLKLISQLVPPTTFDNDIVRDTLDIAPDPLLGTDKPTLAYRARQGGKPVAVVLESIAHDGYSGKINLIIAIRPDSSVGGVRVVTHKETPGLGDYIDIAHGNWIKGFDGKALMAGKDGDWKVKKDGGQFDYMAGATISPRAVVKAVHKALQYYQKHQAELFAQTPARK